MKEKKMKILNRFLGLCLAVVVTLCSAVPVGVMASPLANGDPLKAYDFGNSNDRAAVVRRVILDLNKKYPKTNELDTAFAHNGYVTVVSGYPSSSGIRFYFSPFPLSIVSNVPSGYPNQICLGCHVNDKNAGNMYYIVDGTEFRSDFSFRYEFVNAGSFGSGGTAVGRPLLWLDPEKVRAGDVKVYSNYDLHINHLSNGEPISKGVFSKKDTIGMFPNSFTVIGNVWDSSVVIGGETVAHPEPFEFAPVKDLPFYADIKDYIEKNSNTVFGLLLKPLESIVDSINALYKLTQANLNLIESFRARLFDKLEDIFKRYWVQWIAVFGASVSTIPGRLDDIREALNVGNSFEAIKAFFSGGGDYFTTFWTGFRQILSDFFGKDGALSQVGNAITETSLSFIGTGWIDRLIDWFNSYRDWYFSFLHKIINPIEFLKDLLPLLRSYIDWYKGVYLDIFDHFKDAMKFLFVPSRNYHDELMEVVARKFNFRYSPNGLRGFGYGEESEIVQFLRSITNVEEKSPVLVIPFSKSPTFARYGVRDILIDFDWFLPYRSMFRGFISGFLYLSFAVSQFFGLKSLFSATSSGLGTVIDISQSKF